MLGVGLLTPPKRATPGLRDCSVLGESRRPSVSIMCGSETRAQQGDPRTARPETLGSLTFGLVVEFFDGDVPEHDRIVVPGEAEVTSL